MTTVTQTSATLIPLIGQMNLKSLLLFIALGLSFFEGNCQQSIADSSIQVTSLHVISRLQTPAGDLADRFGFSPSLGFEVGHKFKSNWYVQGGMSIFLGGAIREDSILAPITTSSGFVINDGGLPTEVRQIQQGYIIPFAVGKVIPVLPTHNPNSGLFLEFGGQFIQHKVQFQPIDGPVAALSNAYKKGYDRLTNGFGLRQAIGYQYFSNNGYFNFTIGLDLSQHFTQNRRLINIDTGERDETRRLDILGGLKVSWVFLIYDKAPPTFYYN